MSERVLVQDMPHVGAWVLRSFDGNYFVSAERGFGRPLDEAARFPTREAALAWFEIHAPWVWDRGGFLVLVDDGQAWAVKKQT